MEHRTEDLSIKAFTNPASHLQETRRKNQTTSSQCKKEDIESFIGYRVKQLSTPKENQAEVGVEAEEGNFKSRKDHEPRMVNAPNGNIGRT
jgi:hypothetical protein